MLIIALMFGFDAAEIAMMPPRRSPELWPVEILTDFGKDDYVLALLRRRGDRDGARVSVAARRRADAAARGSATFVEYLFLALAVPLFVTELIKRAVGRGRPFVGGKADPFNFLPFTGPRPISVFRRRMR